MAKSSNLFIAYYQQMPPFAGGTSMRGYSVMPPLAQRWQERNMELENARTEVLTMVGEDPGSGNLRYVVLSGSLVKNQSGLLVRLVGELLMGLRAAAYVWSKHPAGVLLSSPGYWPCLLIAAVCRMRGIPYVLDVRDLYPEVYAHSGLIKTTHPIYRLLQGITGWWYRGSASIAVATEGLRNIVLPQSRNNKAMGPAVEVIYNGFPAALAQIRPPKHERFTVVFHGVLGFFQDIETLCKLAERLVPHGIDMVAVGYGKKEKLLQDCKSPNLRFLGRMNHQQTMHTAAQCHLGLCLRLGDEISKDAFPVKVWEYLGLGMPSIVTPACEAGDFLERHHCGLQMASGNLDALVSAILAFRDSPEKLAAMASNCQQAAGQFTRERMGEQLASLVMSSV